MVQVPLIVSDKVREYWDLNLEHNPLRSMASGQDTSAGAFLSHHFEGAGDILREFHNEFPDRGYIYEKLNRYKNNIQSRDWTDPLSHTEQQKIEETKALLKKLPTENDLEVFIKGFMMDTLNRDQYEVKAKLPELEILINDWWRESGTPKLFGYGEPVLPEGVMKISTSRDTDIGNAASVDRGEIVGIHVTSDPGVVIDALEQGKDISKTRGEGLVGDLGTAGIYFSEAPQLWYGRAAAKWNFLKKLSPEQKAALVSKIRGDISKLAVAHYISESEADVAMRDLGYWEGGQLSDFAVANLAGQPYNISIWEQDYLSDLGIKQENPPREIQIRAKGKFADVSDYRGNLAVLASILKAEGFDGMLVRGGMIRIPQAVVWNTDAVTRFNDWVVKENPGLQIEWTDMDAEEVKTTLVSEDLGGDPEQCKDVCALKDWLNGALAGEGHSSKNYSLYAGELARYNLPVLSSALSSISKDEEQHRVVLDVILDYITEKCHCP